MEMNKYTSLEIFSPSILNTGKRIRNKTIEKLLLVLIAVIGIMGSAIIFSINSTTCAPKYSNMPIMAMAPVLKNDQVAGKKEKFSHFIKIKGKKKMGAPLTFHFKKDPKKMRYVLDIDQHRRVIITSKKFEVTFDTPGEHTLELKQIHRGLISTLATKILKIKK